MSGADDDESHAAKDANGDECTGGQIPNLAFDVLVHGLSPASPPWMIPLAVYYRVLSVLFMKDFDRHCAIARRGMFAAIEEDLRGQQIGPFSAP